MGSRANYIVVRGGRAWGYYDSWGALGLVGLFGEGPDTCAQAAGSAHAVDALMDDAWAEGGFLVDFDRRTALFHGHLDQPDPEDLALMDSLSQEQLARQAEAWHQGTETWLSLIAPAWLGWTVRRVRSQRELVAHLRANGLGLEPVDEDSDEDSADDSGEE